MAKKKAYMTSEDLIASIKRRSMIPSHQSTFTDADFLAFADEETDLKMVPDIIKMHEDYLLYTEVIPVQTNQSRYAIPYRAVGNKLKEIAYQDSSGNIFEMTRIGVGDLPFYNANSSDKPYAYYVENNEIALVPLNISTSQGFSLRMTYYMRPNSLVKLDEVGVISGIDRNTGVISLSNIPEDFTISEEFDLLKIQSPNKTLAFDLTAMAVNPTSKTVTFDVSQIPANLSVGDHVALATQCAVPQIPSDLHVVLAQTTAMRCLEALGDTEGLQIAAAKLNDMDVKMEIVINDRVTDAPRKVVNRHATLRSGLYSRRTRIRTGY